MDFLDFDGKDLYFDSPTSKEVEELINKASILYPDEKAEQCLLRCYLAEPENLSVHVSLYRYYYYKHDYNSALKVAERTLETAGKSLGYLGNWKDLSQGNLMRGLLVSMGLTRYYLHALKASAYLLMRIDDLEQAVQRLEKVKEMDSENQFGVEELLQIAKRRLREIEIENYDADNVSTLSSYR